MAAKPLLKSGLRKSIDSGYNTRVWDEPWIPSNPPRSPTAIAPIQKPNLLVFELIDRTSKTWNVDTLRAIVAPEDIPLILSLRISRSFKMDSFCWIHTRSGAYSVKTGYDAMSRFENDQNTDCCLEPSTNGLIKQVWSTKTSRKIKHFMWQALTNCVPVCSRLTDRHFCSDRTCQKCGHEDETVNHMLLECPSESQTWALAMLPTRGEFSCSSIYSNFDYLLFRVQNQEGTEENLARIPWIIWFLWKAQNAKVFEEKDTLPLEIIQAATAESISWNLAQAAPEEPVTEDATPIQVLQDPPLPKPICKLDASWKDDDARYGGGFVMEKEDGITVFGSLLVTEYCPPYMLSLTICYRP